MRATGSHGCATARAHGREWTTTPTSPGVVANSPSSRARSSSSRSSVAMTASASSDSWRAEKDSESVSTQAMPGTVADPPGRRSVMMVVVLARAAASMRAALPAAAVLPHADRLRAGVLKYLDPHREPPLRQAPERDPAEGVPTPAEHTLP